MVITMYYFHKCASVAWDFFVLGDVLGYGLVKCCLGFGLGECLGVWLGQVWLEIVSWGMAWSSVAWDFVLGNVLG